MNKKINLFLLIAVFVLSFFLRFYKLGEIPPSLDWDEVSLGYNTYCLLKTGRDEYGNFLPINIRSFNDYKASVYVYLSLLPLAIFGLNEFSIRFISAFFGSLTVILVFLLSKKFVEDQKNLVNFFPILTSLLLAVSPWHLHFSRVAFEANLALFFFVLGVYLFLLALKNNFYLPFSLFTFGISLFAYHSNKLVVPIFLILIFGFYRKKIFQKKLNLFISIIIVLLFFGLLVYSFRLGGASRFSATVSWKGSLIENFKRVINGYLSHYDFNFLFIKGDPQPRHHPLGLAQLYFWELPFVLSGIVFLIKNKIKYKLLLFWWFLTAPFASALTKDIPNAVRSLLFLPTFQIFTAFGLFQLFQIFKEKILRKIFLSLVFVTASLSFIYYLHMYYIHESLENSKFWLFGYKELVKFVNQNADNYQEIIVTDFYDQPYIYFLFYQQPTKIIFNDGDFAKGFGKLKFRSINWEEDKKRKNILLIGSPQEIPQNEEVIKEINFLNGEAAFRVVAL